MKKMLLNFMLAVSFLIWFGFGLTALAADDNVIKTITITSAPEAIEIGKTPAEYLSEIVIPESEQYEAAIEWSVYDELYNQTILADDMNFEWGKEYAVNVIFRPKEGYVFPEYDWDITLEAEKYDWGGLENYNENPEDLVFSVEYVYSLKDELTEVSIQNVPEAEVGQAATLEGISFPENVNYELDAEYSGWRDITTEVSLAEGDVFQAGHKYELYLAISAKEGYRFAEETKLYVNGEEQIDTFFAWENSVEWSKEYSFAEVVKDAKIELTIVEPEKGMTVKDLKVSAPKKAKYKVEQVNWYDSEEFDPLSKEAVLQIGHIYNLEAAIAPAKGYAFDETAKVTINGEEYEDFLIMDNGKISLFGYYPIYGDIQKVEIDNVPKIAVGEKITYKGFDIPENADYYIDWENSYWTDSITMENLEEGAPIKEKSEYMLVLSVLPKEGKGFAENVQVLLNGEKTGDYLATASTVQIMKMYSFLEPIQKMEILEKLPEAVVGETAIESVELKVPEGAQYVVGASWFVYNTEMGLEQFTGTFEAGKAYILGIAAMANEGFEFAGDMEIFVKGEKYSSIFEVSLGTMLTVMEVQDLGENTIDVVEISFDEPKIGEEIKTPEIKVPDDIAYEISEVAWIDSVTGEKLTGVFEAGKSYELSVSVMPKENYMLANDFVIKVNGQLVEINDLSVNTLFTPVAGLFGLTYEMEAEVPEEPVEPEVPEEPAEPEVPEKPEEPKEEIEDSVEKAPQTGDYNMVSIWLLFMVASMMCIIRKKAMN